MDPASPHLTKLKKKKSSNTSEWISSLYSFFPVTFGSLKKMNDFCRRRAIRETSEEIWEMGGWRDDSQVGVLQCHHHDGTDIDVIHPDPAAPPAATREQVAPYTNVSRRVYETGRGHAETQRDSGTLWLVAQLHRSRSVGYLTMLKLYSQMKRLWTTNWQRRGKGQSWPIASNYHSTHRKGRKKT